jgi:hypothetical protein
MSETVSQLRRSATGRFGFLDWTRGLAVFIILQGHVFHAFTRPDDRGHAPYVLSQLFGGQGSAIFLFLTGMTLSFLIHRRESQGLGPAQRWFAAVRRATYLWLLAFLFRAQLWLFAYPGSNWTDLFKVDVLNCMGFAMMLFSLTALVPAERRVRVCGVVGMVIAGASPLVSSMNWEWLPTGIRAYIVPSYAAFAFFPWASFIAFGMSAGTILKLTPAGDIKRIIPWAAIFGLTMVAGGLYFSGLPYSVYASSEFWLNSPGLIVIKLGVNLLIVAFAWLWCEYAPAGWSLARQFGSTSLIVYWVHIELVYGRWPGAWRDSLTAAQCVLASVVLTALMVPVSLARSDWPWLAAHLPIKAPKFLLPASVVLVESQQATGD